MEKGDILSGEKTFHPIIFLDTIDDEQFKGCIITHSKNYTDNLPLKFRHFHEKDNSGNYYKVKFDSSYFVKSVFIKEKDWGPFIKVGQLTMSGVSFIENQIKGKEPVYFDDYSKE